MPGFHQLKFMHSADYFGSKNEPIYGQIKQKKKSKGKHPLFEDLKARSTWERAEYERLIKRKEAGRGEYHNNPYNKFDSLKLLGSCNDITYLDSFMSMPRQRHPSSNEDGGGHPRCTPLSKSTTAVFGKGQQPQQHRNSVQSESTVTAAMMSSLKSVASDDNLYESVEMIHYKKTLQNYHRMKKTRSVQKTGHPLFDSLRIEQAMKAPAVRKTSNPRKEDIASCRTQEYATSDGNSPSHSSSSSSDEYETYPRLVSKYAKNPRHKQNVAEDLSKAYLKYQQMSDHCRKRQEKQPTKSKRAEQTGSESDEDWIIPRPKFFGSRMGGPQQRRSEVVPAFDAPSSSSGADESDSSLNSTVLR